MRGGTQPWRGPTALYRKNAGGPWRGEHTARERWLRDNRQRGRAPTTTTTTVRLCYVRVCLRRRITNASSRIYTRRRRHRLDVRPIVARIQCDISIYIFYRRCVRYVAGFPRRRPLRRSVLIPERTAIFSYLFYEIPQSTLIHTHRRKYIISSPGTYSWWRHTRHTYVRYPRSSPMSFNARAFSRPPWNWWNWNELTIFLYLALSTPNLVPPYSETRYKYFEVDWFPEYFNYSRETI